MMNKSLFFFNSQAIIGTEDKPKYYAKKDYLIALVN